MSKQDIECRSHVMNKIMELGNEAYMKVLLQKKAIKTQKKY